MKQNEMLAMILAGGKGTRLLELTKKVAKPAVFFGGKYRIIDFPLSNCANSSIQTVGVLTQYESVFLNSYVSSGGRWGLDMNGGGCFALAPREKESGFDIYRGTADAISQNIDFIDSYNPEYLLILSGDHIYKMNYDKMLKFHKENKADATISVINVTREEASRFGIMNVDENMKIVEFEEKPKNPKSTLASMGIYIFNWKNLRKMLIEDMNNPNSSHDFGKDIIPAMLEEDKKLYAFLFKGYWKDVGTINSLWEANMDLLDEDNELNLADPYWKIYTLDESLLPQRIGENAEIKNSLINQGSKINGKVENSILFSRVSIEQDAIVNKSVLLPGCQVDKGAKLNRVILAENVKIGAGVVIDNKDEEIKLIAKSILKQGE